MRPCIEAKLSCFFTVAKKICKRKLCSIFVENALMNVYVVLEVKMTSYR